MYGRRWLLARLVSLICLLMAGNAGASGIPFSVIGPHEYTLPLDFKPIAEFVQTAELNDDNTIYTSKGTRATGPGGTGILASSKLAYLFQIQSMPSVGFEAELIQPEERFTGNNSAAAGLGDPIVGLVAWVKPTADSTIGLQDYFQLPLGADRLSAQYASNIFSVLGDLNVDRWNIDGDIGVILPITHRTAPGEPTERIGNIYFFNVRGSYRINDMLEPFAGMDWQNTAGATDINTGNAIVASSSYEFAGIAGVMVHFGSDSLTASYHRGTSGRNTIQTNSLMLRWISVF